MIQLTIDGNIIVQSSPILWILILALFALVVAIITPRYGGGYGNRITAAHAGITAIKIALDNYKMDNGFYPKSFNDLLQRTDDAKSWHGPYFDPPQLPIDPWGDNYIYEFPGKHNPSSYDLLSVGPDGKEGTDDDIGNWQ